MSTRPKVKPRPRLRAPPATATVGAPLPSSPGPSSAATATPPPPSLPATQDIEDEDALFIRNKTRTAQAWRHINKLAEEKEKKKRKALRSESSDSERESGSSPQSRRRKAKRRSDNKDELPDWTRKNPNEIIISSDSEDDILAPRKEPKSVIEIDDSPSRPNGRARSRSRSLTPPPALTQHALQRAKEAIDGFVGVVRAPSPIDSFGADDSVDSFALDPELALIQQRVRSQMKSQEDLAAERGGPEIVKLRIVWTPHPEDPEGQVQAWGFEQKRHDNFHELCAEIADLASKRVENVVLTHDGKRVFPSSTPHTLGIWAEAELAACEMITFRYLQEHKRMRSESVAPPPLSQAQDSSRRSPPHALSPTIEELSESEPGERQDDDKPSDTFHLVVRSERTKGHDITLLVRPTTKCGAIVRAFLKKAGLEGDYPASAPAGKVRGRGKATAAKMPVLSVDGDKMDPEAEIGEADLEDGDQVDVVGL